MNTALSQPPHIRAREEAEPSQPRAPAAETSRKCPINNPYFATITFRAVIVLMPEAMITLIWPRYDYCRTSSVGNDVARCSQDVRDNPQREEKALQGRDGNATHAEVILPDIAELDDLGA